MNKKHPKALLAAMIASVSILSLPVAAQAAAGERPVQVFLQDGSKVSFDIDPVIEEGTTLVQFRPIFEKLGLEVQWDGETQTVTGTGKNVELKLQIGSKEATVNGKKVELALAPRIESEVTLVPLRFVGEASGLEVGWDGYNRNIVIAPIEGQASYLANKSANYFSTENMAGLLSCYDESTPEYPYIKQNYAMQFASLDAKVAVKKVEVVNRPDADHAVIHMTKEIDILKGPAELTDNTTTTATMMTKVNGEWKLSAEQILKIENQLASEWIRDDKPTVPAEEQKAIEAAVEKLRVLTEKEDMAGIEAMYDPSYPNLANIMVGVKQYFALYDFALKYESGIKITQFKDKEAYIRYTATSTKVKGAQPGEMTQFKGESVEKWVKNAKGDWVLADAKTVSAEYSK